MDCVFLIPAVVFHGIFVVSLTLSAEAIWSKAKTNSSKRAVEWSVSNKGQATATGSQTVPLRIKTKKS